MTYALVRRTTRAHLSRLDVAAFAQAAGIHPDLLRRLVALGLLEPERDAAGDLWFSAAHLATLGRIQRLRAGFGLNYAALGLVIDLLDRVAELDGALRESRRRTRLVLREAPPSQTRPTHTRTTQTPNTGG